MSQNVIKIESNPYTKEVRYYWKNDTGESLWSDLSESPTSPFSKSKPRYREFFQATIAHKAYDILSEINSVYNKKNGIEIVVDGTDEDYQEIQDVIDNLFPDSGMSCVKGDEYMLTAKEVMPQIEGIYSSLEQILSEYNDSEIHELIARYSETLKPEISLCVMGLYSSGKSAFINALIGKEILPSASDPATAKIYKISCENNSWVGFKFDDKEYRIDFSDGDWHFSASPDTEIITKIEDSLSSEKSTDIMLYSALSVLNDYAMVEGKERQNKVEKLAENEGLSVSDYLEKNSIEKLVKSGKIPKYRLDDLIEIGVPFCKNTLLPIKDYKFVIFDTPGSNSEMHKEHVEILKKSLADRTNGLPVFVTNADTLDNTDNAPVIDMIEKMGKALDGTSTMIVVNKADEKSEDVLKKKREKTGELKVTSWKPSRIFFISSVVSLGEKIENPDKKDSWLDSDYAFIYHKNHSTFDGSDDWNFLELHKINILPKNVEEQHAAMAEKDSDKNKVLWNTGMRSIEYEIGRFGEKFALYNKCTQAEEYLGTAIEKLSVKVEQTSRAIDETQKQIQESIDDTVKELEKKLNKKCEEEKSILDTKFTDDVVGPYVKSYLDKNRISGVISSMVSYAKSHSAEWEEKGLFKGASNSTKYVHYVSKKISSEFDGDVRGYAADVNYKSDSFWKEGIKSLKEQLLKVVYESEKLTDEQKKIAEQIVMNAGEMNSTHSEFKLGAGSGVKKMQILWFKRDIFDEDEASLKYKASLTDVIGNKNTTINTENTKAFNGWKNQLINTLRAQLSKINPTVMELNRILVHYQEESVTLTKQLKQVEESKNQIVDLISFKEIED